MRALRCAALIGLLAAATGVKAQEAASADGVIAYPVAYFADAQPNTALDMVMRLPGFTFDGGGTTRGFAGAGGNVLVDGERPSSKNDALAQVLQRIPAGQVERIDLIRGGAPGIDMQGKSVIANVVRKRGSSVTGLLALASTSWDDGRFLPQIKIEGARRWNDRLIEGTFLIADSADDSAGDGPRRVRDGNGDLIRASRTDTEGDGRQINAAGIYEGPLAGGRLRLNLSLVSQDWEYDSLDRRAPGPADETQHDVDEKLDGEAGLRFTRDLGVRTNLELVGLQTLANRDYGSVFTATGNDLKFDLNERRGESILRGVLRHTRSERLTLETGGEIAFNWLESKTGYAENGTPIALPAANVRVEEERGEAFATATWRPSPKLSVEAGARIEQSTIRSDGDVDLEKTLVFLKPRVLATWSPTPTSQVRVRLEREVGQLDFHDFVASAALNGAGIQTGNPNLEPQQAWVAELALEQRFWDQGAVIATVRHERLTDVVDRVPVCTDLDGNGCDDLDGDGVPDVFDSPGNIGDGDLTEAALDFSLPLDRFGVPGGLFRTKATYRWSRVTDPTTGVERRISGQHAFDGEMHFTQDLPRWRATWGVDATFGNIARSYRLAQIDTTELGTYLSAYIEFKPRPNLSLRAEVVNLGSRPYTQTYKVYSGPRNTAPVQLVDSREYKTAPGLFLRLRRTFG
jgi:hypothetical protein